MDDGGGLPLRAREDDVNEVFGCGDDGDLLEIVEHHVCRTRGGGEEDLSACLL